MAFIQIDPSQLKLDSSSTVPMGMAKIPPNDDQGPTAPSGKGFVPVDINSIKLDQPSTPSIKKTYNQAMGITEHKISANPLDDPESVLNGASQSIAGILQTVSDAVGADKASQWLAQSVSGMQNRQNVLNERGSTAEVSNVAGKTAPFIAAPAGAATTAGRIGLGAASNAIMGITKPVAQGESYDRLDPLRIGVDAAVGAAAGGAPELLAAPGKVIQAASDVVVPKIGQEVATIAQRAKDFGIPLSVSQIAPGKIRTTAQKVSQAIPGSGVQKFEETQRAAWNKALVKTLGEDANNLSPETVNNFLERTGKGFDSVLKGKTLEATPDDMKVFDNIVDNSKGSLTGDLVGVVQKNLDKVRADFVDGVASGDKIASLRSTLVKNASRAQGGAKDYINDMIDHIDDIAERQIGEEGAQQLQELRRQWRNFKTVEPLLEKSTKGIINPVDLQQRVAASPYIKASRKAVGDDDLVDLARIGKELLPIPGGSDTYEKASLFGGGAGAAAGLLNPILGAKIVAGVGANRAFQSFYNQSPKIVEAAISKSLGLRSNEVMKLVKQGAPIEKVVDAVQKSGATKKEVDETLSAIQKFTSSGENPSPRISRAPNPRDKIGVSK